MNFFEICFACDASSKIGMGNISILSYIVILRAHDNHIMVVITIVVISSSHY